MHHLRMRVAHDAFCATSAHAHRGWRLPRDGVVRRPANRRMRYRCGPAFDTVRFLPTRFWMRHFIPAALFSIAIALPASAQKLVDPASVAPEFREAAEKRRAEQIKQRDCANKANLEKVMPRERAAFVIHCLEADTGK
ncbi:hypothetical protein [Bradyrhizobium sp. LjRoot220]|uniref:hypothetical protein n=1 Tax=Bradyrhizobium sp. LjRoot220 TaxID=3342284 RepID=UPI003F4F6BF6